MKLIVLLVLLATSSVASAAKTVYVNIVDYRTYLSNGSVYVHVSSNATDGGICHTVYTIPPGAVGSEQAVSFVMAAHASDSQIEIGFSACTGYGTPATYIRVK